MIYNFYFNVYMFYVCLRVLIVFWIFVMGFSLFFVNDFNIFCVKSRRVWLLIFCENKVKMREISLVWNESCIDDVYNSIVNGRNCVVKL